MMELWRHLEAAQGAHRIFPLVEDPEKEVEESFHAAIDDAQTRAYVVEEGASLVGMALARSTFHRDTPVVELSRVVVDPGARRAGIGAALVAAAEAYAREVGAQYLGAAFFAGNALARAFWERMGFEPRFEARVRRVGPASGDG